MKDRQPVEEAAKAYSYCGLAESYLALRDYEQALQAVNAALKRVPDLRKLHRLRAEIYAALGKGK